MSPDSTLPAPPFAIPVKPVIPLSVLHPLGWFFLRTGLLLLLLPESEQTDTRDLDDLETNTGNITLRLTLTTETGEENLVVLVDEVKAPVVGDCYERPDISTQSSY